MHRWCVNSFACTREANRKGSLSAWQEWTQERQGFGFTRRNSDENDRYVTTCQHIHVRTYKGMQRIMRNHAHSAERLKLCSMQCPESACNGCPCAGADQKSFPGSSRDCRPAKPAYDDSSSLFVFHTYHCQISCPYLFLTTALYVIKSTEKVNRPRKRVPNSLSVPPSCRPPAVGPSARWVMGPIIHWDVNFLLPHCALLVHCFHAKRSSAVRSACFNLDTSIIGITACLELCADG